LGELKISLLIVGVKEIFEDWFGDDIFQSVDYLFVIFSVESGFGPLLKGILWAFEFIFGHSRFNWLAIRHVHVSEEIVFVVV
jgi:hypothetical protein